MPNPFPLFILVNNINKGPPHLVYYINLNLNVSTYRQNIKNLIANFGVIHVGIMHAKFQTFSFSCEGGEWGDRHMRDVTPDPYTKFHPSLCFGRDKLQQNTVFTINAYNKYIYTNYKFYIYRIIIWFDCWYGEGWWKSAPLHWWNFAHTSPLVQGRFWWSFNPRPQVPLCPGGFETLNLKAEGIGAFITKGWEGPVSHRPTRNCIVVLTTF